MQRQRSLSRVSWFMLVAIEEPRLVDDSGRFLARPWRWRFPSLMLIRFDCAAIQIVAADFKSLFQKSPLMSRAVHGATICDVILPIDT